jgi:hypothetical protein
MNDILKHYQSLPRIELQRELRRLTGIKKFYLWEYVGLGWMWEEVRANRDLAARTGVNIGDVVGYSVIGDDIKGAAFGDLMNVESDAPPHPDPFQPHARGI